MHKIACEFLSNNMNRIIYFKKYFRFLESEIRQMAEIRILPESQFARASLRTSRKLFPQKMDSLSLRESAIERYGRETWRPVRASWFGSVIFRVNLSNTRHSRADPIVLLSGGVNVAKSGTPLRKYARASAHRVKFVVITGRVVTATSRTFPYVFLPWLRRINSVVGGLRHGLSIASRAAETACRLFRHTVRSIFRTCVFPADTHDYIKRGAVTCCNGRNLLRKENASSPSRR